MRVLGVTRLSRSDDRSTSLARQREAVEAWTAGAGHALVGVTVDDDVSGDVAPWSRPSLGPWLPVSLGHRDASPTSQRRSLALSRASEWDALVVTHLDRLSRRAADLLTLIDWCKATGRKVFDTSGLDFTGPGGTVILGVLAGLAQGERERMQARAQDAHRAMIRDGRWRGGTPPYGYRVEAGALVVDDAQAKVIRWAVAKILGGQSAHAVCRELNAGAMRPTRGGEWRLGNLQRMVTSDRLLGYVVQGDRPARGRDGLPVRRAEPIIDRDTLERVRERLSGNKRGVAIERSKGTLLLRVLYCGMCGDPMYGYRGGRGTRYYRCGSKSRAGQGCGNRAIRADDVDKVLTDAVLGRFGDVELIAREWAPGDDNAAEVQRLTQALEWLRDDRAAGLYQGAQGASEYRTTYAAIEAQRTALLVTPSRPGQFVDRPTGETFCRRWNAAEDTAARNLLLRDLALRFEVTRDARPGEGPVAGRILVLAPTTAPAPAEGVGVVVGPIARLLLREAQEGVAERVRGLWTTA